MKIKKFDNFTVNEESLPKGVFSDDNMRAIRSWTSTEPNKEYEVIVDEPFIIKVTDDVEFAKIKMMLYKYGVKFTEKETPLK